MKMKSSTPKLTKFIMILVFLMTVLLMLACSGPISETEGTDIESEIETEQSVKIIDESHEADSKFISLLSSDEKEYIDALRNENGLGISISESSSVYRIDENGQATGFHYLMAKSLSEHLELPMNVSVVQFSDYFKIDGAVPENVKTDSEIVYTPDIFESSHLISDNMSILEWREKLMSFVKIIPVSIVVMTDEDTVIETMTDLRNMTVAIEPNTSYDQALKYQDKLHELNLEYVYIDNGDIAVAYVLDGKADFTVKDSNVALIEARKWDELIVNIPISEPEFIGWAVKKDNVVLKGIIEKFVAFSISTGELDAIWTDEYGVSLRDYSNLLGIMGSE